MPSLTHAPPCPCSHIALFTCCALEQVDMNFEPLMDVASMLYGASFVAERYSGLRAFLESGSGGSEALAHAKKRKLQGSLVDTSTAASHSDDASDSEVGWGSCVVLRVHLTLARAT
eukprot:951582-Pelagomonas_calceolata.AAC.3